MTTTTTTTTTTPADTLAWVTAAKAQESRRQKAVAAYYVSDLRDDDVRCFLQDRHQRAVEELRRALAKRDAGQASQ